MNKSDQEYVQEKIDRFISQEYLINNIKRSLREYISKSLRKPSEVKVKLPKDENIVILLKMIHEFLSYYEINNTCRMLEEECGDIFQMNIKEIKDYSDEFTILDDISECNTKIENLLQNKLLYRKKCEIDEVTSNALIEASNCIESLQDEIKTLHNVYFEQVNVAREIMERKVSSIEKLYMESISRNDCPFSTN